MATKKVAGINMPITAETKQFESEMKDVNSQLKDTAKMGKILNQQLKLDPTSVEVMNQSIGNLENQIEQSKRKTQLLNAQFDELEKQGVPEEELRKMQILIMESETKTKILNKQLNDTSRALEEIGREAQETAKEVGKAMDDMEDEAKETEKAMDKIKGSLDKIPEGAKTAAAGVIVGFVAMSGAAVAVTNMIGDLQDAMYGLGFDPEKVDESIEGILSMGMALGIAGVQAGSLFKGIIKAGAAAMTSSPKFDALGISVTNADGSMKSLNQIIPEMVEAIYSIEDPLQRTITGVIIFGRGWMEINKIIVNGGVPALKELQGAIEESISEEDIQTFMDFMTSVDKVALSIKTAALDVLPEFIDLLEEIWDRVGPIVIALGDFFDAVENLRNKLHELFPNLERLQDLLSPLEKTANAVALAIEGIALAVEWVTGAIDTLVNRDWFAEGEGKIDIVGNSMKMLGTPKIPAMPTIGQASSSGVGTMANASNSTTHNISQPININFYNSNFNNVGDIDEVAELLIDKINYKMGRKIIR